MNRDNKIKGWFNEVGSNGIHNNTLGVRFVIYKGFKISEYNEEYFIQDVRFSNMYSDITPECYQVFCDKGFITGVDLVCFIRNTKRIAYYKRKAELLYDKRRKFKKLLNKDRRLNEKRIRNLNRRIDYAIDHIFLYTTRVNQYKIKYKLN